MGIRSGTVAMVWALLAGCGSGSTTPVGDDNTSGGNSGEDTDSPDTDTDTDTDDTDTTPQGGLVSSLVATVDDERGTLIWVSWEQAEDATIHLEFSWDEGIWHESPPRDLGAGPHQELILGAPYAMDVTWRLVAEPVGEPWASEDVVTTTDDPHDDMPVANLVTAYVPGLDPTMSHVLIAVSEGKWVGGRTWTMIIDRQARTVWAHRSPDQRGTMHPRVNLSEDALLIDHTSYWADLDGGAASEIVALKIDGSVMHTWLTPGLHHPFTDMPDGSIAFASYREPAYGGADDDMIQIVSPDGSSRDLAGCNELLNAIGEPHGFCGSNTVSYDAQRHTFLFSLFTEDSIVQIDADTGLALRWFGHVNAAWGFSPPGSAFWYQHGPYFTDDGTILVSTHTTEHSEELMVREYQLDEKNQELVQVWSFGEGEGVVGRQMGEAHRLPGGNTLHNHGTHAVIREVNTAGQVAWDVRWEQQQYDGNPEHEIGRSAPILVDLYAFSPDLP